ncbi:MAG: ABC transporter permease [Streptosporangiales bacterium]|nr:ABC transporter permease [Streptosporangiales bacterium]MBO0890358.1 ABC transporter permease [Acidothermales bacterium]
MSAIANSGKLVRLALRRDRIVLPAWLVVFVLFAAVNAAAVADLYPSVASRVQAAGASNSTPSLVMLYGWIYDPTAIGAIAILKLGGPYAALVGVLAIILTNRHTRSEEEAGRLELIGSTVVGRHSALAATMFTMVGAGVVLGLATAAALAAAGLPVAGSVAFGAAWTGLVLVFSAVTAFIAQLAQSSRTATGLSVLALGVAFVLRAVGDVTGHDRHPTFLTWLSPIGWAQQVRPYAGDRWWVLLITLGFSVLLYAAAYVLASRRDLGAGILPDRPGRATASKALRSPVGLAWRLQRNALYGWAGGFLLMGLVFGSAASGFGELLNSPSAKQLITALGGEKGVTEAFMAAVFGIVAVIASAYGISAALHLRGEESELRAEPLLATRAGRVRWAWSHTFVALAGTTVLLLVNGIGAGITYAAHTGDGADFGRLIVAALVQLPAVWVLTGFVVALFGLLPRLTVLGWVVLAALVALSEVGPLVKLDKTVLDVSPFAHIPKLPGGDVTVAPLAILVGVAAVLVAAGLVGFRRRDIAP